MIDGDGKFSELDNSIPQSFEKGRTKHLKYMKKLGDQAMTYSAHTLDPRHRMDLIKNDDAGECGRSAYDYQKLCFGEFSKYEDFSRNLLGMLGTSLKLSTEVEISWEIGSGCC